MLMSVQVTDGVKVLRPWGIVTIPERTVTTLLDLYQALSMVNLMIYFVVLPYSICEGLVK